MAVKTKAGDSSVYNANTNWANEEAYLQNLINQGNQWAVDQMGALQAAKQTYTQPQSYAQAVQPTVYTQPTGNYTHSLDGGQTYITAAQSLAKQTGVTEQQAQQLLDQGRANGTVYSDIMQQARQQASDNLYEKYLTQKYAKWLDLQDSPGAYVAGMPFEEMIAAEGGLGNLQLILSNANRNMTVLPLSQQTYADIISKASGGALDGSGYSGAAQGKTLTGANVGANGQYVASGGVGYGAGGNKQTTTYIDENGNKQTGIVANSSYLDSMLNQLNQQYQQQLAQADNAAAAATQKAILALEKQKASLDQQYQGMYEQLYINRRMNEKNLPEQLAAMGYTGGLTESALLQLQNDYQNNVRQGEVARLQGINDLDAAIAEAQLTGDLERANALMELSGQYYTNYAQVMQAMQEQANYEQQMRYQMLMQEQAQQESLMEQAAENGWILLENGILPDASTLSAMGLTAEQAQALMKTVSGGYTAPVAQPEPTTPVIPTIEATLQQMKANGATTAEILAALTEAKNSGALSQSGYMSLYSKYRG